MLQSTYTPTSRQKLIAWMFLGSFLLFGFLQIFGNKLFEGGTTYYLVTATLSNLMQAAAFLLLALSARNLSGRLLGFVFMGIQLVDIIFVFVPLPGITYLPYVFLTALTQVWLFTVLLKNNLLSANNRTWVHVLVAIKIMSLSYSFYNIATPPYMPFNWSQQFIPCALLSYIACAVGFFFLARSEAFGDGYDRTAPVSLAPTLKPVLAFGIGAILLLLLVVIIYNVY